MSRPIFTSAAEQLLLDLLKIDTRSPLETGQMAQIEVAQERLADFARHLGFDIVHLESADPRVLSDDLVPRGVIDAARQLGQKFWEGQPNLVIRAGKQQPMKRTLMINFHIDTVGDFWEPAIANDLVTGRGAADAKGPGVAALAGVVHAVRTTPQILKNTQILIQSVSGEEGGAMGIFGTRALFRLGFSGRLNLFAEPSDGVFFDSATTTMTARIEVNGHDATDDTPSQGDNATLLLSFLSAHLSSTLCDYFEQTGYRMCVAGLHTGAEHNRVYGSGRLHLNFAYPTLDAGREIEAQVEKSYRAALDSFAREYISKPLFARTAKNAIHITRLQWLKRGLPVLDNRDAAMERVLAEAGLTRCPPHRQSEAFTCDAIWGQGGYGYSVVFGPGDLSGNHAHAREEFVSIPALEAYAADIASIVTIFAAATT